MTEQNKKKMGNPEEAHRLSLELMHTLRDSDSFKHLGENKYAIFDILIGIAYFTENVLSAMEVSANHKVDMHKFYINDIMKTFNDPDEAIARYLSNYSEEATAS